MPTFASERTTSTGSVLEPIQRQPDASVVALVLKTNTGASWALPQVRALLARGNEVVAFLPAVPGNLHERLRGLGAEVVPIPWDFSFRPAPATVRGLLALRRAVRSVRPSAIFYHLYASALAVRLALLGSSARKTHMVAGPLYLENRWIRAVERLLWRLDDAIIPGSAFTERAYLALGAPASRLHAIPYGVDTNRFAPDEGGRADLGAKTESFVAIMVAYVYAPKGLVFPGVGIKGHEVLLEAWDRFVEIHPDSRLILVGGGFDEEGETYRTSLRLGRGLVERPDILWIESVPDVRPYYNVADVSVSPSLSENHGAALEASAMGVPSIVSDAGGLPEAVTSQAGWVVPTGDADALLGALLDARARWEGGSLASMGRAARSHMVEHFDSVACSECVADVVTGIQR